MPEVKLIDLQRLGYSSTPQEGVDKPWSELIRQSLEASNASHHPESKGRAGVSSAFSSSGQNWEWKSVGAEKARESIRKPTKPHSQPFIDRPDSTVNSKS
jgi:hypothetical protein